MKAEQLFTQVRNSPYGHLLIEDDPRLYERLLHVHKHLHVESMELIPGQRAQLMMIPMAYCDTACLGLDDLPEAKIPRMRIDTKSKQPIHIKMRPTPFKARDFVEKEVQMMLDAGIIRRIHGSRFSFPIVIAHKPGGKFRMCIDYRMLNRDTNVVQAPIPRLEDAVQQSRECITWHPST